MFRIGEFSKMSKTTIKTLRYYDEVGLLKPVVIDRFTNYRFYSSAQLLQLQSIQAYRQVGLSIKEIKLLLSERKPTTILEKRKAELLAQQAENITQLSRIDFILAGKEKEKLMNYTATIKELPKYFVYSKRLRVPDYDAYFELIPKIGETISEQYPRLKCATPEYCFCVYLDGQYQESDFEVEVCEAVDKLYPDFADFTFKELEPTTVLSVFHRGPYSTIAQAYSYAFNWLAENPYEMVDNPRESFIDGIWNQDGEQDWLTELQIPIRRSI